MSGFNKEQQKKIAVYGVCLLVVGFIGGVFVGINHKKISDIKNNSDEYEISITETKSCNEEAKLYYEGDGRNIYTYCLDSVNVNGIELKELLKDDEAKIDDIIAKLGDSDEFWDGGSELYKDGGSVIFTGEEMNLLKCKTIVGNRDIYIGNSDMEYEEGFCERKVNGNEGTFTRTYQVLNIAESNDFAYLYVTVRQFQVEGVETVKVMRAVFDNYEVGKYYEFTFKKNGIEVEDNIKSIFEDSTLGKVVLTDKTGLAQVNDEI